MLDGCRRRRVKTLFLSPLQPQKCGRGWGEGGGRVGGVSRLRFSPGPRLRSSRFSRPSFWGPGPKPPGDLARPWGCTATLSCKPNFQKPMGPGLKTLGCYHNQSADLGGRWIVSEGGALQSHGWPLSPASRQPSRIKNSKNAPVLIG